MLNEELLHQWSEEATRGDIGPTVGDSLHSVRRILALIKAYRKERVVSAYLRDRLTVHMHRAERAEFKIFKVRELIDGPYTSWVESGPEGGPAMVSVEAIRAALGDSND